MRRVVSMILASLLVGTLALAFNVGLVHAQAETVYINGDGSISPSSAPISTVDNITYTLTGNISYLVYEGIVVERNNIVIDGNGYTVQGEGNPDGLILKKVNNVTIKNTSIEDFHCGIYFYESNSNNVSKNNITNNSWCGIYLQSSNSNSIRENNLTNNKDADGVNGNGILLVQSSDSNSVSWNNITNNAVGIGLSSSSVYNTVVGNNVVENSEEGMWIDSCSYNVVFHNNFVENFPQVRSYYGATNTWDNGYPSGGNYWSDNTSVDVKRGPNQDQPGSDGIGDTPYVIDADNTDNYPLMNPWASPDIAVADLTSFKTVIGQGYCGLVNVTFENLGNKVEAFNATVYANSTCIHSEQTMLAMTNCTLSFTWNTTGFTLGNYTISACAEPVLDEINIANNNCTGGFVFVTGQGDLTGGTSNALDFVPDGKVDITDVSVVAKFYGKKAPPAPVNCDVSGIMGIGLPDGKIDITDVATVAKCYGQHY